MKVVVEDANVLLDLVNGEILGLWLGLEFENCTTHLVWAEVSHTAQTKAVQPFIDSGSIVLHDIPEDSWTEVVEFSKSTGVSIPDASVWLLAKRENAVLLTGDSKLRKSAKVTGVEVRGLLWVLDELVQKGRLPMPDAARALESMIQAGAFLPSQECSIRIVKWRQ